MEDIKVLNYFRNNFNRANSTTNKFRFSHHSFSNPIIRLRNLTLKTLLCCRANLQVSQIHKL